MIFANKLYFGNYHPNSFPSDVKSLCDKFLPFNGIIDSHKKKTIKDFRYEDFYPFNFIFQDLISVAHMLIRFSLNLINSEATMSKANDAGDMSCHLSLDYSKKIVLLETEIKNLLFRKEDYNFLMFPEGCLKLLQKKNSYNKEKGEFKICAESGIYFTIQSLLSDNLNFSSTGSKKNIENINFSDQPIVVLCNSLNQAKKNTFCFRGKPVNGLFGLTNCHDVDSVHFEIENVSKDKLKIFLSNRTFGKVKKDPVLSFLLERK